MQLPAADPLAALAALEKRGLLAVLAGADRNGGKQGQKARPPKPPPSLLDQSVIDALRPFMQVAAAAIDHLTCDHEGT